MNYVIEGNGALVNDAGEEQPLRAGDYALVNLDEKRQYSNKWDQPIKMICGVSKGIYKKTGQPDRCPVDSYSKEI